MKEGLRFVYLRDRLTKDGRQFRLRPARAADSDQIIANISAVCAEKVVEVLIGRVERDISYVKFHDDFPFRHVAEFLRSVKRVRPIFR